ncbi:Sel1 repeat family protein [Candidatus Electronema halotolerans]
MTFVRYSDLAIKYKIEDIRSASIPGGRFFNILQELESKGKLFDITQKFLQEKGFFALLSYARGEASYVDFVKIAEIEKSARVKAAAEVAAIEKVRQKLERDALVAKQAALFAKQKSNEKALFAKLKNDPRNKARERLSKLREQYGLTRYIEQDDFAKLMEFLRHVDNGKRLSDEQVVWLYESEDENGENYFTEELKRKYHENEAKFYHKEFEKNKDPWFAVNASSHYRKFDESRTAEKILKIIDVLNIKNKKLKSAICTTHGGVKRDLGKWDQALGLGKQAHEYTPQDFRPCTLLGAVYIETGQHGLGHSWYEKAIERGYSQDYVDSELRTIYQRLAKSQKKAMRDDLLRRDPDRYNWAR